MAKITIIGAVKYLLSENRNKMLTNSVVYSWMYG